MKPDWQAIRAEFPALAGRTYLNTATYGQLPRAAVERAVQHFQRRDSHACADFLEWFDDLDPLRAAIGRLLHATAADIAFVPNASSALALAMSGFDWQAGDEILTLEDEFPNQLYAAQAESGVRGVECRWDELDQYITARTRLVLLSTVNYVTGFRPDLTNKVAQLRERGIFVYVDGTQSVGALAFDCEQIRPHFLAVDAYKWMISPNGAGFVYIDPEVRKWLRPQLIGWRSDSAWRTVDCLHHGAPRFGTSAEKYEGGMLPFPSLYAMQAAVELLERIGPGAIEQQVLHLAGILRDELANLGGELYSSKDGLPSQIVAAHFPSRDPSALANALKQDNILVSARKGYLRISPHFYNNENDVDVFLRALHNTLQIT
jgi:cysteine desulfurase / selenocysteine lyase